ncbi:chorismate mutase [uncultured Brachyspira sp.]|uniref:chorismate mutase n=1 Tax=uncultured Brachyspira sp. TaxID=221953 RepID=UPI0025D8D124|nr:chorismate mutase [uncultured Brachyspira sp.]
MLAEELQELRKEIDKIDKKIVNLIDERMKISIKVGETKKKYNAQIFDPKREKEVIQNKIKLLENKELSGLITTIYSEIMYTSKQLQKYLIDKSDDNKNNNNKKNNNKENIKYNEKIVYQGREGGNGYEAALKFFGENANLIKKENFDDVLESIRNGESYYGVLPLENSSTGMVNEVLDILADYNCKIVGEIYLPIEYGLMAKKNTCIKDIKKVISHHQALKQCSNFIKANNFETITASNTAEAAFIVSNSDDKNTASISNKNAYKFYDLEMLEENIENINGNTTRFIIVANYDNALKNGNKMTIRFLLPHKNGSLAYSLNKLKNFNLVSIVSRPHTERKWQYYFYVDMTGDFDRYKKEFEEFEKSTENLIILGIYDE